MLNRRTTLRKLVLWYLLLIPAAGLAASGDEFYQRLFERGMAHFAVGEYASAYTDLRHAAFGFVEQVDKFETVQAYAAVAAHRLGNDSDARESLLRIVGAEKVQPHYRSVKLPDDLRAEDDRIAAALLTTQECTILGVPTRVQDTANATKTPAVVPTPGRTPNVAVTAPREKGDTDAQEQTTTPKQTSRQPVAPTPPTPVPQRVVPAPQPVAPAAQPVVPLPQPVILVPQPPSPMPQPVADPVPQSVSPVPEATAHPTPAAKHDPPPQRKPVPPPQPVAKATDVTFAEAQRAIDNGEIGRARSIYNALLSGSPLAHDALLRLGEGMYRVHDFAGANLAFQRAGTIGRGEEQYHYYYAVALYEAGRYREAKRELAASLPYISMTADVARYQAKIAGAIE